MDMQNKFVMLARVNISSRIEDLGFYTSKHSF